MRMLLPVLICVAALTGCNTIEGVGRDVQGAGEVVEDGAKKVKKALD